MTLGEIVVKASLSLGLDYVTITEEKLDYMMRLLYAKVEEEAKEALLTEKNQKVNLTREIKIAREIIHQVKRELLPVVIENTTNGVRVIHNHKNGYLDDIVSWTSRRYYNPYVIGAREIATAMAIMDVCPIANNKELSQLLKEKQYIWGR